MQIMYLLLSFIKLKTEYDNIGEPWPGGILLIDELDATLHPAAQIRLIDLIYKVCKQFNFQAVFTTHSLQILEYLSSLQIRNSDINIEYFTTANGKLEIHHNPPFEAMENDMMISTYYLTSNNRKINIYSEDAEARYFIRHMLADYKDHFRLLDIKLGGESLMNLLYNDPDYFKNVLFILDGDKDLAKTKYAELPAKHCNVIFLPGNEGPEALLYNYLINLPPTHEILQENFDKGISIRMFKEMNPLTSPKYASYEKNREKYKHWFIDNTDITLENWHEFSLYRNNDYLQDKTSVQIGFAGLFLNRTNFSGILKANPLGGLNQQSQYPINCRFNKDKIINSIQQLSLYGNKITLYNLDAIDFMKQALRYKRNRKTFVYIDPPYYKEGANLYRCYYTHEQHMLLSKFILSKTYPWLISYDNAEEIRKMYKQLSPLTIHMDYSVHTSRNAEELLISNIKIPPMEPSSTTIEPLIG